MSTTTDLSKIMEKIKKCLALASSSNANEAETAFRQAHKLMAMYNIDQTDIGLLDVEAFTQELQSKGKHPVSWIIRLATVCATAFQCEEIYSQKIDRLYQVTNTVTFIGVRPSGELAGYTYEILKRQLTKDRKAYLATQKRCLLKTRRERADLFALAWIQAVQSIVNKFAEVDQSKRQLIKAYIVKKYPNLSQFTPSNRKAHGRNASAIDEGHKAGQNAHPVTGSKEVQLALENL